MRASVSLCMFAVAMLVVAAPAVEAKDQAAVVVIHVEGDTCSADPKGVVIVDKNADLKVKGPKKVRFFFQYCGKNGPKKVTMKALPDQDHPDILALPELDETTSSAESSETKKTFDGDHYVFKYEIDVDGVKCDPEICIKKADGTCSGY